MQRQKEAIEKIVNGKEPATFDNTIAALDYSSLPLDRVRAVFSNLCGADTNEKLQAIEKEMTPLLTKHADDILLSGPLFARVKAVYDRREELKLTDEQRRLLEETYRDFARNGVALPPEKQDVLRKLNERISSLQVQFSNNLLAETKAFKLVVDDRAALAGLPETLVAAAAEAAKKDGQEGKWLFTTDRSVYIPFLTSADNRASARNCSAATSSAAIRTTSSTTRRSPPNWSNYESNGRNCSAIRTMRPTCSKSGWPRRPSRSAGCSTAPGPWPSKRPSARRPSCRRSWRTRDKPSCNRGTGGTTPKSSGAEVSTKRSDLKPYFELSAVRNGAFDDIGRLYGVNSSRGPICPSITMRCRSSRSCRATAIWASSTWTSTRGRASGRARGRAASATSIGTRAKRSRR